MAQQRQIPTSRPALTFLPALLPGAARFTNVPLLDDDELRLRHATDSVAAATIVEPSSAIVFTALPPHYSPARDACLGRTIDYMTYLLLLGAWLFILSMVASWVVTVAVSVANETMDIGDNMATNSTDSSSAATTMVQHIVNTTILR